MLLRQDFRRRQGHWSKMVVQIDCYKVERQIPRKMEKRRYVCISVPFKGEALAGVARRKLFSTISMTLRRSSSNLVQIPPPLCPHCGKKVPDYTALFWVYSFARSCWTTNIRSKARLLSERSWMRTGPNNKLSNSEVVSNQAWTNHTLSGTQAFFDLYKTRGR